MSSNISVKRICVYCNKEFTAKTTTTKYCSKKCNTAHYKEKLRALKVERSNEEIKRHKIKPIQDILAKEFLTVKDVSILLGCSTRTVYRLIKNGTINAVNLSERIIRINKRDLENILKQSKPHQKAIETKPVYAIKKPQQIQVDIQDCYTMTEIQKKYGISEKALQAIINKNNIPKLKYGWHSYVPKILIDKILS